MCEKTLWRIFTFSDSKTYHFNNYYLWVLKSDKI